MDTKIKSLIFLIFLILFSNSSSKKLSYMLKSQGSKISRGVVDMLLGLASAIFGGNSSELNKCLPANARNSRWAKDTFTKDSLTKFGETNKYLNIVITGIKVISKIACFLRKNYNKIAKLFGKGPKVIAFIQS